MNLRNGYRISGDIFADPRSMVVIDTSAFNALNEDVKNAEKVKLNTGKPKERFRKLRLHRIGQ